MPTIIPETQPVYWLLKHNNVTGLTQPGENTAVSNSVSHVQGEGEYTFLDAVAVDTGVSIPTLPDAGAELTAGDVYDNAGTLLMVRQDHIRTEHDPANVPALFLVARAPGTDIEWIAGEDVALGVQRTYEGTLYQAIQGHVTQEGWEPPNTPALWEVVSTTDEWQAGVAYAIDDEVVYQDVTYVCIQAHTSQVGWEPPNVPALWEPLP